MEIEWFFNIETRDNDLFMRKKNYCIFHAIFQKAICLRVCRRQGKPKKEHNNGKMIAATGTAAIEPRTK